MLEGIFTHVHVCVWVYIRWRENVTERCSSKKQISIGVSCTWCKATSLGILWSVRNWQAGVLQNKKERMKERKKEREKERKEERKKEKEIWGTLSNLELVPQTVLSKKRKEDWEKKAQRNRRTLILLNREIYTWNPIWCDSFVALTRRHFVPSKNE